jgi:hypothetical protein
VRSVLVGLVFVLAALVSGISVQQEFIAERSSEPPKTFPPVAADPLGMNPPDV